MLAQADSSMSGPAAARQAQHMNGAVAQRRLAAFGGRSCRLKYCDAECDDSNDGGVVY
jgi:hypothetical protein